MRGSPDPRRRPRFGVPLGHERLCAQVRTRLCAHPGDGQRPRGGVPGAGYSARGLVGPVIWSLEEVRDEPFRVAGPFEPAHLVHRASAPGGAVQLKWLGSPCRDLLTVTCSP